VGLVLCCLGAGVVQAQLPGDADCSGELTDADLDALAAEQFPGAAGSCPGADVNGDGPVSAADVPVLVRLLRPPPGPVITFLGVRSSDGRATIPLGKMPDGTPVYFRNAGFGFQVVVEAAPGRSGAPVGTSVSEFNPNDPGRRPDLQIQVNRPLGDGSTAVCDREFGVFAVSPPSFAFTQSISNALNDLACRALATTVPTNACTQDEFEQTKFVDPSSRAQFCLPMNLAFKFPLGDTLVTVQVRDQLGNVGPAQRLMIRVGSGPMPPTFTPVPPTATRTPSPTRTVSATPTQTRSPTRSPTRMATMTRVVTSVTPTRGPSSPTRTGTRAIATPTPTRTRTITETPAGAITRTPTPTRTPTRTSTSTAAGPSRTPTRTPSVTNTPEPTADSATGPLIVFFGITTASNKLVGPEPPVNPDDPNEIRVYRWFFGSGFWLVVEARQGISRRPVGSLSFSDSGCPDFQVQVTRPLGSNPTEAVCDTVPGFAGGVPPLDPPLFDEDPTTCDRLNDLGCRFVDGENRPQRRPCTKTDACIKFSDGESGCADPDATAQFCGYVSKTIEFPPGETLVTARMRDDHGNLGPPAQIIVRIEE